MLQIRNVTKAYDGTIANNNLSFDVNSGSVTILAGPNGAGKSTIIKSIAGLLRFKGDILIGGYSNKTSEARSLLGYVPEVPNLYEMLTVYEHLEFIARAYSLDKEWEVYADELMKRFELDIVGKKVGKELSKGMQQKVSICCALLHKPKLILFDEPLVGLDPHAIKELKNVFKELAEDNRAVLISTHMLDSVETVWDTVHIMMNGQIAATRTREQINENNESLENLFFSITERH